MQELEPHVVKREAPHVEAEVKQKLLLVETEQGFDAVVQLPHV